jgi:hypothetical protein
MLKVTKLIFHLSSGAQLEVDSSFAVFLTVALNFGIKNLLHTQFSKTLEVTARKQTKIQLFFAFSVCFPPHFRISTQ